MKFVLKYKPLDYILAVGSQGRISIEEDDEDESDRTYIDRNFIELREISESVRRVATIRLTKEMISKLDFSKDDSIDIEFLKFSADGRILAAYLSQSQRDQRLIRVLLRNVENPREPKAIDLPIIIEEVFFPKEGLMVARSKGTLYLFDIFEPEPKKLAEVAVEGRVKDVDATSEGLVVRIDDNYYLRSTSDNKLKPIEPDKIDKFYGKIILENGEREIRVYKLEKGGKRYLYSIYAQDYRSLRYARPRYLLGGKGLLVVSYPPSIEEEPFGTEILIYELSYSGYRALSKITSISDVYDVDVAKDGRMLAIVHNDRVTDDRDSTFEVYDLINPTAPRVVIRESKSIDESDYREFNAVAIFGPRKPLKTIIFEVSLRARKASEEISSLNIERLAEKFPIKPLGTLKKAYKHRVLEDLVSLLIERGLIRKKGRAYYVKPYAEKLEGKVIGEEGYKEIKETLDELLFRLRDRIEDVVEEYRYLINKLDKLGEYPAEEAEKAKELIKKRLKKDLRGIIRRLNSGEL